MRICFQLNALWDNDHFVPDRVQAVNKLAEHNEIILWVSGLPYPNFALKASGLKASGLTYHQLVFQPPTCDLLLKDWMDALAQTQLSSLV